MYKRKEASTGARGTVYGEPAQTTDRPVERGSNTSSTEEQPEKRISFQVNLYFFIDKIRFILKNEHFMEPLR